MQHKLLSILGLILLLLLENQCKCSTEQVRDTINVSLQWRDPQPIEAAGLDIKTANGLSCRVPSEDTTYFINAVDGKTYRFTQEKGTLECQASDNLASFNLEKGFVFAAGSMQKQSLYFGTVSGSQITIHQLEEGTWKQVISQNATTFFPGSILQDDKHIVACTLQIDGQQQGCVMFIHQKAPRFELGCLLFDPIKKNLTKVNISPSYTHTQRITNDSIYLIGALGIKPGKILLGKGDYKGKQKDSYDLLQIEANRLDLLAKNFKNSNATMHIRKGDKARWELFYLVDKSVDPTLLVPMFTVYNGNIRSFFRLNSKADFQQLTSSMPADIIGNPGLVIPLGEKLYVVTTRPKLTTYEQQNGGQQEEETIYYQAQLDKDKEEESLDE